MGNLIFGLIFILQVCVFSALGEHYAIECGGSENDCICNYDLRTLICSQLSGLPDVEDRIVESSIRVIKMSGISVRSFPTDYFNTYRNLELLEMRNTPYLICDSIPDDLFYQKVIPDCEGKKII